jgi:putative ABC transport system substrate-binding protein
MKTRYTVTLAVAVGFGLGAVAVQGLHAQAKPPIYYIAEIDVKNVDAYTKEYKRLALLGLIVLGVLVPPSAEAQPATRIPRIGYLAFFGRTSFDDAFRDGLRDLGYVDGQNIMIEYRSADANLERVRELAAELVRLNPDLIVTTTGESTRVVMRVTSTVPIVMAVSGDAVRQGLVASLARPGGNVTGLTTISPELSAKRLQLLKEALPNVSRVAFLWCPGDPVNEQSWREVHGAAPVLGLRLQSLELRNRDELPAHFEALRRERMEALLVSDCPHRIQNARVGALAAELRLPTMYPFKAALDVANGLLAYGPSVHAMFRRTATYVGKILKGAKPADLPVEQPTKFELVVNLKTAKALGLTIPPSVLARADEIIQ